MIIPIHITYTLQIVLQWILMICIAIDNGSNHTVRGRLEAATLVIKLYENLLNTTSIWSVAFIANARLELVYLGSLIRPLNVSLKLTVSF